MEPEQQPGHCDFGRVWQYLLLLLLVCPKRRRQGKSLSTFFSAITFTQVCVQCCSATAVKVQSTVCLFPPPSVILFFSTRLRQPNKGGCCSLAHLQCTISTMRNCEQLSSLQESSTLRLRLCVWQRRQLLASSIDWHTARLSHKRRRTLTHFNTQIESKHKVALFHLIDYYCCCCCC